MLPGLHNLDHPSVENVASEGISLSFNNSGAAQSGHRNKSETFKEGGLSREPTDFFSLEVSGKNLISLPGGRELSQAVV